MGNQYDSCRRCTDDPRHPVRIPASLEVAMGARLPRQSQIVNLSRGGLAVRFFGTLDPGAAIRVTLHRRHGPALACTGRVAWVDRVFRAGDGSAGVAFRDALGRDLVTDIATTEAPQGAPTVASPLEQ